MIHTETREVAIDELTPWPRNPRRGNVDLIAARWQKHTGQQPVCNGEQVNFLQGGVDGDPSGLET